MTTTNEPHKREPSETRKQLLESAGQIILEKGISGLTLDGVAKRAGVSKGGLLHHFSSKRLLLDGLVQHLFQEFTEHWQRLVDADDNEEGKHVRAYARAVLLERNETGSKLCNIIAVEDRENDALKELRKSFLHSLLPPQQSAESDPVKLAIVQLAIDGLWLAEIEGLFNDAPELRAQVIARLMEMTRVVPPG